MSSDIQGQKNFTLGLALIAAGLLTIGVYQGNGLLEVALVWGHLQG